MLFVVPYEVPYEVYYRFNNQKSKHRAFRKGNQKVPQKSFLAHYCLDGHSGRVAKWLVTCAQKPKIPGSSLAATYVQRWALRSNHPANV